MLCVGKNSFFGAKYVRDKAKPFMLKILQQTNEEEAKKSLETAEYILKELEAMGRFHRYRHIRKSYAEEEPSIGAPL